MEYEHVPSSDWSIKKRKEKGRNLTKSSPTTDGERKREVIKERWMNSTEWRVCGEWVNDTMTEEEEGKVRFKMAAEVRRDFCTEKTWK